MKIREIINEAPPVGTSGTIKTATGSTGTGAPNPAPAAKPYTDKEFQQALDAYDINDQPQKAKELGKNVVVEPGAQAAMDRMKKDSNPAAYKAVQKMMTLKGPALKVDQKQIDKMIKSGPAT